MTCVRTLRRNEIEGEIQRHLDLRSEDSVVLIEGDDYLLVKKTHSVAPEDRFRQLCVETETRFQKAGVTPKDVEDAVRWARESS
jgi:hypothetical protein